MRKKIVNMVLAMLVVLGTIFLFSMRIKKSDFGIDDSASAKIGAEKTTEEGSIYDVNGVELFTGGTYLNEIEETIRLSMSNLLGPSLKNTFASTFYVRGSEAEYLYGLEQKNFKLSGDTLFEKKRQGGDIQLTIDSGLNGEIYDCFQNHGELFSDSEKAAGGCVVLNYKTGEILGMVSYPGMDLLDKNSYRLKLDGTLDLDYKNSRASNRCLQISYMPASLMKPLIMASVLTDVPSAQEYHYQCTGKGTFDGVEISCAIPHNQVGIRKGIQYSCNGFAEAFARQMPKEDLESRLKILGFNQPSFKERSIGHYEGSFPDVNDEVEFSNAVIGEGSATTTVLHMATAYSAIFNQGDMVRPYITESVSDRHLADRRKIEKTETKAVFSQEAVGLVLDGMKLAAESGTASILKNDGVAAKTGTAEENAVAWTVAGFLDRPYLVVVILEDSSYSGGKSAGIITHEVLNKLVERGY